MVMQFDFTGNGRIMKSQIDLLDLNAEVAINLVIVNIEADCISRCSPLIDTKHLVDHFHLVGTTT
jgi:hypothetical protein